MPDLHLHDALLTGPDVTWSFRDSQPKWAAHLNGERVYNGTCHLDPFPGYQHSELAVAEAMELVSGKVAPLYDVHLFRADREEVGRSNGFAQFHQSYIRDEENPPAPLGIIFLSGKRVPPHPAMSRYLVAHEYGHHITWMLEKARGLDIQRSNLLSEYAELRGGGTHHGEGGTWHDSIGEIFACDFRILVCGVETEFWPHMGITRPEYVEGLQQWWDDALKDLAAAA